MKIQPFIKPYITSQKKNFSSVSKNFDKKDEFLSFKGKQYPSGYYNDKEIEYAKKYLGTLDWEDKLRDEHMQYLLEHMNGFKYVFTKAPEKETEKYISEVRKLMIDLNNEKIREAQEKQRKIQEQQKELEKEIRKKEQQKNEKLRKEQLNAKIKDRLTTHFLNPLKDDSEQTPTAILIECKNKTRIDDILKWLSEEITGRIVKFELPKDEDDALYRLNTELQYAQECYEKTQKRTVLIIDDFSHILKNNEVSKETIADMKAFLFALSEDKEPISIIFNVADTKGIDSAFLNNKRRIPLRLNFEDLTLGQKKNWQLHLSDSFKQMNEYELEIYKYHKTNSADDAIRNKDYRKVIKLKEEIAMICEMQGKERDAYLLRCDIENYLKKI